MASPLHSDPGDPHADITSHDWYVKGFPYAAFERLRRVDRFEVGEPDRLRSNFIRGIKHLPVKVG